MGKVGIEFVMNREPQGCFGADVEALVGVPQDDVHGALAEDGLYTTEEGVSIVADSLLNASMSKAGLAVTFREVVPHLPHYNGMTGDEVAIDKSTEAVERRFQALTEEVAKDDNEGVILLYPCKRTPEQERPFSHYLAVATVALDGSSPVFTVMDASELPNHGGVFEKDADEMRGMLVPYIDEETFQMNPVSAWAVTGEVPEAQPEENRDFSSLLPL